MSCVSVSTQWLFQQHFLDSESTQNGKCDRHLAAGRGNVLLYLCPWILSVPHKAERVTEHSQVAQGESKATLGHRFPFCPQNDISLRKGIVTQRTVSIRSFSDFPRKHFFRKICKRWAPSWESKTAPGQGAVCLQKQPTSGVGHAEVL